MAVRVLKIHPKVSECALQLSARNTTQDAVEASMTALFPPKADKRNADLKMTSQMSMPSDLAILQDISRARRRIYLDGPLRTARGSFWNGKQVRNAYVDPI